MGKTASEISLTLTPCRSAPETPLILTSLRTSLRGPDIGKDLFSPFFDFRTVIKVSGEIYIPPHEVQDLPSSRNHAWDF